MEGTIAGPSRSQQAATPAPERGKPGKPSKKPARLPPESKDLSSWCSMVSFFLCKESLRSVMNSKRCCTEGLTHLATWLWY